MTLIVNFTFYISVDLHIVLCISELVPLRLALGVHLCRARLSALILQLTEVNPLTSSCSYLSCTIHNFSLSLPSL